MRGGGISPPRISAKLRRSCARNLRTPDDQNFSGVLGMLHRDRSWQRRGCAGLFAYKL